jgi:membrane protein
LARKIRVRKLLRDTLWNWYDDNAAELSAALAFFTVLSLAPFMIIAVGVAGAIFGEEAARGEILAQISNQVGPAAGIVIQTVLLNAKPSATLATVLGSFTVLLGATAVFVELQNALNRIWKAPPQSISVKGFLRRRLLSFLMLLGVGFVLLLSVIISTMLSSTGRYVSEWLIIPRWLLLIVNFAFSVFVTTLLFGLIYRILPDTRPPWKVLWSGAAMTSLLFNVGKAAISYFLANTVAGSAYGAASSFVLLLFWIYYSAQIFYLGAEFTHAYAMQLAEGRKNVVVPMDVAE